MTSFLPEYSFMKANNGRFRPLFRLFEGSGWKFVRKGKVPIEFDTDLEALKAAKECVKCILNPPIRAEQAEVVADVLGVDAWQRERAGQAARDQQEAFGQIFVKGRAVAVEKRRARV